LAQQNNHPVGLRMNTTLYIPLLCEYHPMRLQFLSSLCFVHFLYGLLALLMKSLGAQGLKFLADPIPNYQLAATLFQRFLPAV
jgi:hypothetical protein